MNKLLTIGLSISVMTILGFTSCKKDNDSGNGDNNSTLNVLFEQLKSAPQTFSVVAGSFQTIEGADGLIINFYPESFLDANDNIISNGETIEVKLIETLTYDKMIANRVQTTTQNNRRLISAGSFHLEASLNGQALKANKFGAYFPAGNTQPTSPMAIFTGYETPTTGGPTVMWYDDTTQTTMAKRLNDNGGNSNNAYYYLFDSCTDFGWTNADYFDDDNRPKTDIGVALPNNTYNDLNTEVFVVFKSINSVTKMYNYLQNSNTFIFSSPNYHIPIGEVINVVSFSEKNGSYYMSAHSNITVTNNHTVNIDPQQVNLTEIATALANL